MPPAKRRLRVYKTRPKRNPERYYYSGSHGGWVRLPARKRGKR